MILTLLAVLVVMLAVMSAAWLTVRATDNGGWTDVFWTFGTGATLALAALTPQATGGSGSGWRHVLVAALAAAWSLRLGSYIAVRVARGAGGRALRRTEGGVAGQLHDEDVRPPAAPGSDHGPAVHLGDLRRPRAVERPAAA